MDCLKKNSEEYAAGLRKKSKNQKLYKKRIVISTELNDNTNLLKYNDRFPYLLDSITPIVNSNISLRLKRLKW